MKSLILNEYESELLLRDGVLETERNGFPILVEINSYFDEDEPEDEFNSKYSVTIINCYGKIIIKK